MAFVDWSTLKTQILDALADGNILTGEYEIEGRRHKFRSLEEVMKFLELVDTQIAAGSGRKTAYAQFERPSEGT